MVDSQNSVRAFLETLVRRSTSMGTLEAQRGEYMSEERIFGEVDAAFEALSELVTSPQLGSAALKELFPDACSVSVREQGGQVSDGLNPVIRSVDDSLESHHRITFDIVGKWHEGPSRRVSDLRRIAEMRRSVKAQDDARAARIAKEDEILAKAARISEQRRATAAHQ